MIRIIYKIHKWLAIPFGLLVTIIALTGALLEFESEINRWSDHDIYYIDKPQGKALPIPELMSLVSESLPDSVKALGITIYPDESRTYQISLSKPPKSSIYIDQYTGTITGTYQRSGFFLFVFRLHRWLLDSGNPHGDTIMTGRLITGTTTLLFVITLLTGVIIWTKRLRKGFWKSLTIPFRKGAKGFLKGLHVAGGMYVVIILICMGLTGLTWSFKWYSNGVNSLFGANKNEQVKIAKAEKSHDQIILAEPNDSVNENRFALWQEAFDTLRQLNPDAKSITINNGSASVSISKFGNVRAADKYIFSEKTGILTPSRIYSESRLSDNLQGVIYSVHTGNFGGMTTRGLWFIAALLGSTLPLTGYYIWIRSLVRKKEKKFRNKQ